MNTMILTKKHKIVLGSLLAMIVGYFLLKNKTTNANKNTTGSTGTPNVPATTPASKTVVVDRFSTTLSVTYEGQKLYLFYDGKVANGIGYLENGTLITLNDAVLKDGNYIKRTAQDGAILSSYLYMLTVDGIYTKVYGESYNKRLSDFPQAVAFLENGVVVYSRIVDENGTIEYGT